MRWRAMRTSSACRGMGIGAVIDLRRPDERERQPSRRWAGFSGVVVENHDDDEGRA